MSNALLGKGHTFHKNGLQSRATSAHYLSSMFTVECPETSSEKPVDPAKLNLLKYPSGDLCKDDSRKVLYHRITCGHQSPGLSLNIFKTVGVNGPI